MFACYTDGQWFNLGQPVSVSPGQHPRGRRKQSPRPVHRDGNPLTRDTTQSRFPVGTVLFNPFFQKRIAMLSARVQDTLTMPYSLATLWYERPRYLAAVL